MRKFSKKNAKHQSFDEMLEGLKHEFAPGKSIPAIYDGFSEEFYLSRLAVAQKYWNKNKTYPTSEPLRKFAYAGCCKFSRWFVPHPFVLSVSQEDNFSRFLNLLIKSGSPNDNVAPFKLQKTKNQMYRDFHLRKLTKDDEQIDKLLVEYENEIARVPMNAHPGKVESLRNQKRALRDFISAARSMDINTVLRTIIPFPISKSNIEINFEWRSLRVKALLKSTFRMPRRSFVNIGTHDNQEAIIVSSSCTKWDYGETEIEVRLPCLVDHPLPEPPLTWVPDDHPHNHFWPSSFAVAYELVERLCWHVGSHPDGIQQYALNPSDIGFVQHKIFIGGSEEFSAIKGHPGEVISVTWRARGSADKVVLNEADIPFPPYSRRARITAENYLRAGETNNAIIWINIATEALLRERVCEFSVLSGQHLLADEVYEEIDRFQEAKSLVEHQLPEMAKKINWPKNSTYKPSTWQIIKRLSERVPIRADLQMVSAELRRISEKRGASVHGEEVRIVPPVAVKEALDAYDWLQESFVLDCE